jgi:hypothetical protein
MYFSKMRISVWDLDGVKELLDMSIMGGTNTLGYEMTK